MNDIDDRLVRAGELWRDAEPPASAIAAGSLPRAHAARTRWWVAAAVAGIAGIAAIAVWRGLSAPLLTPAASPTAPTTPTAMPTTVINGMLHLVTDPDYDWHDPLELKYVLAGDRLAPGSDAFQAETAVDLDRSLPTGPITIRANERDCHGEIIIEPDREVDVVLSVDNGTCSVEVVGTHPVGAIDHPEPYTAVGVIGVVGSEVLIRRVSPGPAFEPILRAADGQGHVLGVEVSPGRYELTLIVDRFVRNRIEVDVLRGSDFVYNLKVVAPDVPRDCGAYDAAECEAIITEAYAWGLYVYEPDKQALRSVTVRPTRYGSCDGSSAVAKYDVAFDVVNARIIEVTVAVTPAGNLYICTY